MTPKQNEIAVRVLKEIRERLKFLVDVGLDYLTLARASGTLSGGESQRIRLASQIGSGLTGVLYVLDEPSIGLHQRDNARLLETLKRLRDLGNTVIVVEHDEDAIRTADHVVDIGPGAGIHGGQIVAQGTPDDLMANPNSHHRPVSLRRARDRRCPSGGRKPQRRSADGRRRARQQPQERHRRDPARPVHLRHRRLRRRQVHAADRHALQGAGAQLNGASEAPAPHDRIEGLEHLDKVIDIDQSPIGRTPRSNPATYTGAFTPIREWFAGLPEAKARGYEPGRFSFNVKGGRCEACQGDGVIKIEMHFLPDVYVTCDVCKGKRYNRETLEVMFKGKSIADVLDMTVEEALEFFKAVPRDPRRARRCCTASASTTSTSASRPPRCRAARRSASSSPRSCRKRATGRTLYILDEPTTGLHFHDVAKLLEVLHELVEQRQHRGGDRAQSRGDQDRRLDHRPRPRRRRRRRRDRRRTARPRTWSQVKRSYTGQFLKPVLARRRRAAGSEEDRGGGVESGCPAMREALKYTLRLHDHIGGITKTHFELHSPFLSQKDGE